MSNRVFAILLLSLLVVGAFAHEGHDHDHEGHDHEGHDHGQDQQQGGDIPEIDDTDYSQEDYSELIKLCKDIKFKYFPLLDHKFKDASETAIMTSAANLGKWLEDAKHKHLKKDHEHFSCDEAKEMVAHSTANEFMTAYAKFITNGAPGKSNAQVIETMKELRESLFHSHLVNQGSIDEVDDAISDLEHLGQWYVGVKATYDRIIEKKADCTKDFVDYIKEMDVITTDKHPNWEHLHQGLESLLSQCHEDEILNKHLGEL